MWHWLADKVYHPIPENVKKYKKLYELYKKLSDMMAKEDSVGRELRILKNMK